MIVGCLVLVGMLLGSAPGAYALDPALDVSQYAHTAWTVRDGFSLGNIYAMAQTPDGLSLARHGIRIVSFRWRSHSSPGNHLQVSISLRRTSTPTRHPRWHSLDWDVCRPCNLEWRQADLAPGTWSHSLWHRCSRTGRERCGPARWAASGTTGRLCAIRNGSTQCYGEDGAFGRAVWALYEDSSGNLWAGAQSGLWRWKPGPPKRYADTDGAHRPE